MGLYLRVNGVLIKTLAVRRKMVSGAPIGDRELVIEDPVIGKFSIDERFSLEYTYDRRRKWEPCTIMEVLDIIDSIIQPR